MLGIALVYKALSSGDPASIVALASRLKTRLCPYVFGIPHMSPSGCPIASNAHASDVCVTCWTGVLGDPENLATYQAFINSRFTTFDLTTLALEDVLYHLCTTCPNDVDLLSIRRCSDPCPFDTTDCTQLPPCWLEALSYNYYRGIDRWLSTCTNLGPIILRPTEDLDVSNRELVTTDTACPASDTG